MTKEEIIEECKQRLGFETDYEMYSPCQHEKDFYNAIIKALEQPTSEDCVSRAEVFEIMGNLMSIPYDFDRPINEDDVSESMDRIKALPPVMPTQCIAAVKFSKDDLREICNERIEIECTHGTCKDCKRYNRNEMFCTWHGGYLMQKCNPDFYCADFEKRGDENEIRRSY